LASWDAVWSVWLELASVSLVACRDVGHGDVNLLDPPSTAAFVLSSISRAASVVVLTRLTICLKAVCHVRELTRARVNRLGAALGGHHGRVYGGADLIDEPTDLLGGTPDAVGELTDFVGDHGETLAALAGAGRFDGSR